MRRYGILGAIVVIAAIALRLIGSSGLAFGDGVKGFFVPFVELYLDTFNSPTTATVLCGAMIVVAIWLLIYYWRFKIGPVSDDLTSFAVGLETIEDEPGSEAALHRVDELVERHAFLSKSWALYRGTLERGTDGRVAARFSPDRYFDLKSLQLAGLRLRIFLGLPNDFVGIGLVFTFLGLVAGLYFASQSMMSADLGAARDALVLLLHAATFKFLTSITGIGLSLILSWAQRGLMDGLQDALSEVQFQLERVLPVNAGRPLPLASAVAPGGEKPALRSVP